MRLLEAIETIKNLRECAESAKEIDRYHQCDNRFAERAAALDKMADDLEDYMEQRLGWSGTLPKELVERLEDT